MMPHITSEVDREGLFSQSSHINHPKRARTSIRNYERLVIGKYRIQLIYLDQERVMKKFMDRFQKNNWKEDKDRDDNDFLKLEKEVFTELFSWNKAVLDVIAEEEADYIGSGSDGEVESDNVSSDGSSDKSSSDESSHNDNNSEIESGNGSEDENEK